MTSNDEGRNRVSRDAHSVDDGTASTLVCEWAQCQGFSLNCGR
jgi:hypothetical protein